jgi:pimeloyl-ACP methyl ester carboxylesterase
VCTVHDRAIPPRHQLEMAELIPGSELFEYDDGHMACLDPAFGEELARVCQSVARRIAPRRKRHA